MTRPFPARAALAQGVEGEECGHFAAPGDWLQGCSTAEPPPPASAAPASPVPPPSRLQRLYDRYGAAASALRRRERALRALTLSVFLPFLLPRVSSAVYGPSPPDGGQQRSTAAAAEASDAALARNPAVPARAVASPPSAVRPCTRSSSDGCLVAQAAGADAAAAANIAAAAPPGLAQRQPGGYASANSSDLQQPRRRGLPAGRRRPGGPRPSLVPPGSLAARSAEAAAGANPPPAEHAVEVAPPDRRGATAPAVEEEDEEEESDEGGGGSSESAPPTPTGRGGAEASTSSSAAAAASGPASPAARRQPARSLSTRALERARGAVSLERTLLGVISCLVSELRSGKLAHLAAGLSNVDPVSAVLVWHHQRATRRARKADAEYLGPDLPPFDVPPLAPALRALRHAGGVYGSLARAFTHTDATVGDLVKARAPPSQPPAKPSSSGPT